MSLLAARNRQPLPSLSIPIPTFEDFRDSYSDSVAETPEYEVGNLNLGAETPESVALSDEDDLERTQAIDLWTRSGFAAHTSVPTRPGSTRTWRSSSLPHQNSRERKREVLDRDCGICFEMSVAPCRTPCCGAIFCFEHISDWLHGSSADGRCPSCQAPCTVESTTRLMLSPCPSPPTRPRSQTAPLLLQPPSANSHSVAESESRASGYRLSYRTPPSPLRRSVVSAATSSSSSSSSPSPPSPSPSSQSVSIAESTPPSSAGPSNDGDEDKSRVHPKSDHQHPSLLGQQAELSPWESDVSKMDTGHTFSRVTSVVGLTLFLYILFNS